ncbi:GTP-binding protein [Nocardiopsis coralliicola]
MRIVLVAGLHRAARREAVEALLASAPGAIAVHHDLSGIGRGNVLRIVRDRTGDRSREQVQLDHACASCTLREDLIPFLLGAAARGEELCVVEAWDSVEPRLVAESIAAEDRLHLAAVAAAVDPGRLTADLGGDDDLRDRGLDIAADDTRTAAEVLTRQVEYAGTLFLRDSAAAPTRALLAQLNPEAATAATGPGIGACAQGAFDTGAAHARTNPAWARYRGRAAEHGVSTVVWTRTRPLHPERFSDALEGIVGATLRGRGRFWLASQPDSLLVWESHRDLLFVESGGPWLASLPQAAMDLVAPARRAAALQDWDPATGDRRQHLAFTGTGLDADRLVRVLDFCLIGDAESADGFRCDPFAEFSER